MKETGKYRRKDEPTNSVCKDCKCPIWVRMGTYTSYHGKQHLSNDCNQYMPESVTVWDTVNDSYNVCNNCSKEYDFSIEDNHE